MISSTRLEVAEDCDGGAIPDRFAFLRWPVGASEPECRPVCAAALGQRIRSANPIRSSRRRLCLPDRCLSCRAVEHDDVRGFADTVVCLVRGLSRALDEVICADSARKPFSSPSRGW